MRIIRRQNVKSKKAAKAAYQGIDLRTFKPWTMTASVALKKAWPAQELAALDDALVSNDASWDIKGRHCRRNARCNANACQAMSLPKEG
jgi:hypothetical protein